MAKKKGKKKSKKPISENTVGGPQKDYSYHSLLPLTTKQIHQKHKVRQAYLTYWEHRIFQAGWEVPCLPMTEVLPLLDHAAELVVRIRSKVDDKRVDDSSDGFFWLSSGSAKEYLWEQTAKKNPSKKDFVYHLVHHTFRDSAGYVQGLSKEKIDSYLIDIEKQEKSLKLEPKAGLVLDSLKENWKSTKEFLSQFLEEVTQSDVQKGDFRDIEDLSMQLERTNNICCSILDQQRERKKPKVSPPSEKEEDSPPILDTHKSKEKPTDIQDTSDNGTVEKEATPDTEGESEEKNQNVHVPDQNDSSLNSPDTNSSTSSSPAQPSPAKLKIDKISHELEGIKPEIQSLSELTNQLDYNLLENDPNAINTIESLQQKCLKMTEGLMSDLFKLDEIVNHPELRPERKENVLQIQNFMKDIDTIGQKLRNFQQQLKGHKEEEQKQSLKETTPDSTVTDPPHQKPPEISEEMKKDLEKEKQKKLQERWNLLKLNVKFDVEQTRTKYIVQAYIPNMKEDDIHIQLSSDHKLITVQGIREPSKGEEKRLREIVHERIQSIGGSEVDEEALVLKIASGRFGTFKETWKIPQDVDAQNISANYQSGVFSLTLPKKMDNNPDLSPFWSDSNYWW